MASGKKKKKNGNRKETPEKKMKIVGIAAACLAAVGVIGVIASSVAENRGKAVNAAAQESTNAGTVSEAVSGAQSGAENALCVSADDLEISHYADIEIKDRGTVTVALDRSAAPETVDNFVALSESGFYDGLTFHRIMDGFMMQGGDPNGDGTGGSEKTVKGEFSSNGVDNPISHVRGAISMARSQDMDSASSQFFIVQSDSTFLDGQYAGFGFVTEGMDIVDAICKEAEPTDNNGTIPKEKQPVITSITIRENEEES